VSDTTEPTFRRLLLVGMMGAGKSTVGKALAARLGWLYADSDEMVERETGQGVAELWSTQGEPAFRKEESRVLAMALADENPSVVSVAGGAVLDPENRRLVRTAGAVVWLRARPETLAARVGRGDGRPLLSDDPGEALARLEPVRRPFYEEVSDVVVDVDGLSPNEVTDRVLEALGVQA